jgi:hypothetical protein
MTSRKQLELTAGRIIMLAFAILFVGLLVLLIGGTSLPQWLVNLLVPGVPAIFITMVTAGLWMQVDPKRHG